MDNAFLLLNFFNILHCSKKRNNYWELFENTLWIISLLLHPSNGLCEFGRWSMYILTVTVLPLNSFLWSVMKSAAVSRWYWPMAQWRRLSNFIQFTGKKLIFSQLTKIIKNVRFPSYKCDLQRYNMRSARLENCLVRGSSKYKYSRDMFCYTLLSAHLSW